LKSKQDAEQVIYKQECLTELIELERQGHIDIFYGDESGFCLTPVMAYSWQYPGEEVRIFPQKAKRINVFGMLNKDNRLATFQKEGSITTDFVINSIEKWLETVSKPTVLVLDNAPIHQAKAFLARLAQWQEKNLFIFFLPAYCPHLNKIETFWRKIKYEWLRPKAYTSLSTLKEALAQIFTQFGQQYTIHFS
jgi:transposase